MFVVEQITFLHLYSNMFQQGHAAQERATKYGLSYRDTNNPV